MNESKMQSNRRRQIRAKKHRLPEAAYFGRVSVAITACVQDRKTAFRHREIVDVMVRSLADACTMHECRVPVYCFMPDHAHILIQGTCEASRPLRAIIQFKEDTGRWFAATRPEFEWQVSFYDRIIRAGAFCKTGRYITANPVRAGLVETAEDYPFTGCVGLDWKEALEGLSFDD